MPCRGVGAALGGSTAGFCPPCTLRQIQPAHRVRTFLNLPGGEEGKEGMGGGGGCHGGGVGPSWGGVQPAYGVSPFLNLLGEGEGKEGSGGSGVMEGDCPFE